MKLFAQIFFAFLALVGLAVAGHREQCMSKNKHVMNAINRFCVKKDIVTSTSWTVKGKRSNNGGRALVKIDSSCKPPMWIPSQYCYNQFYRVCATGGAKGRGWLEFGPKGCQKFEITQWWGIPK